MQLFQFIKFPPPSREFQSILHQKKSNLSHVLTQAEQKLDRMGLSSSKFPADKKIDNMYFKSSPEFKCLKTSLLSCITMCQLVCSLQKRRMTRLIFKICDSPLVYTAGKFYERNTSYDWFWFLIVWLPLVETAWNTELATDSCRPVKAGSAEENLHEESLCSGVSSVLGIDSSSSSFSLKGIWPECFWSWQGGGVSYPSNISVSSWHCCEL